MYKKSRLANGRRYALATLLLGAAFLLGCGSVTQHQTTGFKPETQLLLRGHSLLDAVVVVSGGAEKVISKEDIQPANNEVFGVKRGEDSKKDTVIVNVKAGRHQLEVIQKSRSRFRSELFVSEGQTKVVEIPR